MRASYTCAKTAGDGRASFLWRNAKPCGHIEQHGFYIAVRQSLGRDEPSETERGEVQSGVALTDRCVQELLFFRRERRGSIAAG